jgi:photosystem II stability/assembly factor-like uncharacterized protein
VRKLLLLLFFVGFKSTSEGQEHVLELAGRVPADVLGISQGIGCGRGRAFISNGRHLWTTTDDGKTWTSVKLPPPSTQMASEVTDIRCIDQRIWILYSGEIFDSTDAGSSWNRLTMPPFNNPMDGINSIFFSPGGSQGWVTAAVHELPPHGIDKVPYDLILDGLVRKNALYTTKDGGQHWQRIPVDIVSVHTNLGISFFDGTAGILWSRRPKLPKPFLAYTTDAGVSWHTPSFPPSCCSSAFRAGPRDGTATSLALIRPHIALVSFSDGYLIRTTNGGREWCQMLSPGNLWPEDDPFGGFSFLHFFSVASGLGVGRDGYVYETSDAGKTWARKGATTPRVSFGLAVDDRSCLLFSGREVFRVVPR